MARIARAVLAGAVVLFAAAPVRAGLDLPAGQFATEGGWGRLTVYEGLEGRMRFDLLAVGGNAHSCALDGDIDGNLARLEPGEGEICTVSFDTIHGGLRVTVHDGADACRWYCGMRADFVGDYFLLPDACVGDAVEVARTQFKARYDRRDYAAAIAGLDATADQCGRFIGEITRGWIASDIAIALKHQGDLAGCRERLAPYAELAALSAADIESAYPPAEAPDYARLARAVRTNLKLCAPR
jgi:hypothetical protein